MTSITEKFVGVGLPNSSGTNAFDYIAWFKRAGFEDDEQVARKLDVAPETLASWRENGFKRIALLALAALEYRNGGRKSVFSDGHERHKNLKDSYNQKAFDYLAWRNRAGFIRDEDVARELDVTSEELTSKRESGFDTITRMALWVLEQKPEMREWIPKSRGEDERLETPEEDYDPKTFDYMAWYNRTRLTYRDVMGALDISRFVLEKKRKYGFDRTTLLALRTLEQKEGGRQWDQKLFDGKPDYYNADTFDLAAWRKRAGRISEEDVAHELGISRAKLNTYNNKGFDKVTLLALWTLQYEPDMRLGHAKPALVTDKTNDIKENHPQNLYDPKTFDYDAWSARLGFSRPREVTLELNVSRGTIYRWLTDGFDNFTLLAMRNLEYQRGELGKKSLPEGRSEPEQYDPKTFDYLSWRERAGYEHDTHVAKDLGVGRSTLLRWRKEGFDKITLMALWTLERETDLRDAPHKKAQLSQNYSNGPNFP